MKNYSKVVFYLLLFSIFYGNVFAHSNDSYNDSKTITKTLKIEQHGSKHAPSELIEKQNGGIRYLTGVLDDMSHKDFPTLHPMVVHIPVILIPLALIFAIISIFSFNKLFFKLGVGFLLFGIIGGFIAAFPMHPHTINLDQNALNTLSKHDFFAYTTLWLGTISVLLGLVYFRLPWRPIKLAYITILLFTVMSVSITGNYGGKLAYIHGIGVQGQYLNTE